MPLVIASQFDDSLNDALRRLPAAPTVIDAPKDAPWAAADEADVLLVSPLPVWAANKTAPRPAGWPGRLSWVYSGSVGIDLYPPWLLEAPQVSCGRDVSSEEIADYVISAIHARNLDAVRVHSADAWKPLPLGRIAGSTVGIVGLGDIGSAVARRAVAQGARVIGYRRTETPSRVAGVEVWEDLPAVVAAADHLVLALPATPRTRGLFDAALFAQARPTTHLVNVSRGSVIDQQALVAALNAGQLAFATLDVTDPEPLPADHPLWTHPRVRLTPHIASNYLAVRHILYDKILANVARFARGEPVTDLVDPAAGY